MKKNKRIEYWNEIYKQNQRIVHKVLKLQKHPNHYLNKWLIDHENCRRKFKSNIY